MQDYDTSGETLEQGRVRATVLRKSIQMHAGEDMIRKAAPYMGERCEPKIGRRCGCGRWGVEIIVASRRFYFGSRRGLLEVDDHRHVIWLWFMVRFQQSRPIITVIHHNTLQCSGSIFSLFIEREERV